MLLRKEALELHRAVSVSDPRLNGILVRAGGNTVATDGHILFHYQPDGETDPSEYPSLPGCDPAAGGELAEFVLPVDSCKEILRSLPKGRSCPMPVLREFVALDVPETNANGCAVLGTTDLESPQVFRPMKPEAEFPRWESIVSSESARTGDRKVCLGIGVLEKALKTLKALGAESAVFGLAEPEAGDRALKPVTVTADLPTGKVFGLIMPRS